MESQNFMTFSNWYSKYDWHEERNVIDFRIIRYRTLIKASPMTYLKKICVFTTISHSSWR